jgi:3-keto-5-aminohexanoate cleavage enzyme
MRKIILEVRCNEYAMRDANPHVPWSPGAPTHDVEVYGESIRRVRAATDLIVIPTLGAHTLQDPTARVAHIVKLAGEPATRPDFAPVDLASTNLGTYRRGRGFAGEDVVYVNPTAALRAQIRAIRQAGVAVDAVLWNVGSARLLGALIETGELETPQLVELVLSEILVACHPPTQRGLDALLDFLPPGKLPWLALCAGADALDLIPAVVERGGHLAIGLGDFPYRQLGAPRNADVIAEAARRARAVGAEPASPAEARALLAR